MWLGIGALFCIAIVWVFILSYSYQLLGPALLIGLTGRMLAIAAVVTGHLALSRKYFGLGRGQAITGLVIGYLLIADAVLGFINALNS